MNPTAVAAALSITILQLWQLMRNPGFPVPTSNAGDGVNIVWNTAAIIAFVSLWNAAKANGWIISTADLPVANLATMGRNADRLALHAGGSRSAVGRRALTGEQP